MARRVLANQHRAQRRRDRLGDRLRDQMTRQADGQLLVDEPDDTDSVRAAMQRLADLDREVLALSRWVRRRRGPCASPGERAERATPRERLPDSEQHFLRQDVDRPEATRSAAVAAGRPRATASR